MKQCRLLLGITMMPMASLLILSSGNAQGDPYCNGTDYPCPAVQDCRKADFLYFRAVCTTPGPRLCCLYLEVHYACKIGGCGGSQGCGTTVETYSPTGFTPIRANCQQGGSLEDGTWARCGDWVIKVDPGGKHATITGPIGDPVEVFPPPSCGKPPIFTESECYTWVKHALPIVRW